MGDVSAGELLGIVEAAKAIGVHPKTLRRRLLFLHERSGNVLVSFSRPGSRVGKWHVRKQALLNAMREDPTSIDERLHEHSHRIDEIEIRLNALRNSHRSHKRADAKWKKQHQRVVSELSSALKSIANATGLLSGTIADIEDSP